MSKENLQAFAEAVSKSEELQKEVIAIQREATESIAGKVAKLSESAGTPFTAKEYLNSLTDVAAEISDEQLQEVAGGGFWATIKSALTPVACQQQLAKELAEKIRLK